MNLKKGDVVVSRVIIMDIDQHGEPYIHALVGTRGVVISVEQPHFPNINWEPEGHGVCNVPTRLLVKEDQPVWWAVDFPAEVEE